MTGDKPKEWANWIALAEWWYNTTFHTSAGMTPYQALYNQIPPTISYQAARSEDLVVIQFAKDRIQTLRLLKENLSKSQERMKVFADRKRTDREFNVGDEVFLKLQPYRQSSVAVRTNQKLAAKYYGPYKVLQRVGKVAYKLQLPAGARIHDTIHVSQLKKRIGVDKAVQTTPPNPEDVEAEDPKPYKILERKLVKKGNYPAVMVKVQWTQGTEEEATWEDWYKLKKQFPEI